jgi:hypothetical protein
MAVGSESEGSVPDGSVAVSVLVAETSMPVVGRASPDMPTVPSSPSVIESDSETVESLPGPLLGSDSVAVGMTRVDSSSRPPPLSPHAASIALHEPRQIIRAIGRIVSIRVFAPILESSHVETARDSR